MRPWIGQACRATNKADHWRSSSTVASRRAIMSAWFWSDCPPCPDWRWPSDSATVSMYSSTKRVNSVAEAGVAAVGADRAVSRQWPARTAAPARSREPPSAGGC